MLAKDVSADLLAILERYWGYTSFRPLQREAMEAVLARRDSLLVLPTGGGKSLCFQAPALATDGLALVVSPLIALMKDQVDTLVGNGVPAACYHSGLDADTRRVTAQGIRAGDTACSTSRPSGWSARAARGCCPSLAISRSGSWPSTKRTASASGDTTSGPSIASSPTCAAGGPRSACTPSPPRPRRACGATSSISSACRTPVELVGSFDRPNLVYRVLARSGLKKQLDDILARHRGQAGIIYCQSRREVDALAAWLVEQGRRAVPYHAGTGRRRAASQSGRASSTRRSTSWWRPSPSAWASTDRTSASSCTRVRPSRSSTISRKPGVPAATGSRPSVC